MPLLTLRDVTLGFGAAPLLDSVNFTLDRGERVCVVGRNGEGKSTLLKVVEGRLQPDSGEIVRQGGLTVAAMPQEVPTGLGGTVFAVVAAGLGAIAATLTRYHALSERLAHGDTAVQADLAAAQEQLDAGDGWALTHRVEQVLSRLELDGEADFGSLSGGRKRRVLLARALVAEPDILLLDEPTNHLDISSITWMEEFFRSYPGTLLFITHDRAFLQAVATRIIELDRGVLRDFPCRYGDYLQRKEQQLEAEAQANALFDKKLAQEEVWIRQGIKARRTRNEGRVRALKALREERAARRERSGNVAMAIGEAERSGKLVLEATDVRVRLGGQLLVDGFSATVMRGDKIGLIGDNGMGKTTLVRALLGEIPLESGSVRHGTKLEVAYFDQLRTQLDEEKSVLDNVAQGSDFIDINGTRKHALAYLQDFLFAPQRARTPVKALSGGERNRLLLARLFTRPANLLVMDEPTNDLDIETLELLEELLVNYKGTLLLISHDRAFLNNVVDSTWAFEGGGRVREYVGGYDDWLRQRGPQDKAARLAREARDERGAAPAGPGADAAAVPPAPAPVAAADKGKRKLSYKEQRELDALPGQIAALEVEQAALQASLNDPQFFVRAPADATAAAARLAAIDDELLGLLERWEALENP
ncbi:MAG TPA: ATP-binding cassette domain-containing protein [Moraxellaceae bacterium]|nr:ATP-binding cassette domain-containing protein [Moraxellaceae bacterium]